jgi:hypothetical protein
MAVLIATTVIAFIIAMVAVYALHTMAPAGTPVILSYFVIPLVIFVLATVILSKIATPVNTESSKLSYYLKYKAFETINSTSYMQIFPPILIVILGMVVVIGLGYKASV